MIRYSCVLFVVLILFIAGCGDDKPGHDLVSKTWDKYYSTSSWETGPLFGGTAILMNDIASYWLKDGKVYVCNGVAMSSSPGTAVAPPSIDQANVEKAIKGKAPAMPPSFPLTYTAFLDSIMKDLKPYGFKKSIWSRYEAPGVEFHLSEAGGMLTKAGMSCRAQRGKMEAPLKTMMAFFSTLAGLSPAESQNTIMALFKPAKEHFGQAQTLETNGALFTMTATESNGKKYLELTAVPCQKKS